jgi:hypothetical protein
MKINLSPSNPIQAAFQSIWAQLLSDDELMARHQLNDSPDAEDTVIEVLEHVLNSAEGIPDNGSLEAAFWEFFPLQQPDLEHRRAESRKAIDAIAVIAQEFDDYGDDYGETTRE